MKKFALSVVVAGIVAALYVVQQRKLASERDQVVMLSAQLEEASRQVASSQAAEKHASAQVQELLQQTDGLTTQLQARQQPDAAPPVVAQPTSLPSADAAENVTAGERDKSSQDKNGLGDLLSKMMQDPDTKKFLRDQQRLMMDPLYAPLIKKMGLISEESETFKVLLADNMMQGAEKASSLFGGSLSNRTDALNTLFVNQKEADDRLKGFLGEDRFALYQDYNQTVNERMQLGLLKQQTSGGQSPLTDDQVERLLAIMKEEKQKVAATGQTLPGAGQNKGDFQAMMSGEQAEKLLSAQQSLNQSVYQRANEVLSPDQLSAFATFQTNQLQMMRMGMSMAQKFFGSPKADQTP